MKKLATSFGLLALMLIVTSFTTPSVGGQTGGKDSNGGLIISTEVGGNGSTTNTGGKDSNGGLIVSNEVGGQSTGGRDSNGGL